MQAFDILDTELKKKVGFFLDEIFFYICFVCVNQSSCVWLFVTPMDCSLPVSSGRGILQARILEWVAMDLPDPGIEPESPTLQAGSLLSEPPGKPQIFK